MSLAIEKSTNKPPVRISVIVPVKNEELNLPTCLDSVSFADEVWVVDSASSDRTAEIARAHGAQVVQFEYRGGFPKKKNWALANLPLRNEWVLLIDADERVTPELETEIRQVLGSDHQDRPREIEEVAGYYINRKLIFLGRWIRHCGWYPSWNMRLFKHSRGRFERLEAEDVENAGDVEVHEHVVLSGGARFLAHDLLHEDFKSVYHFVERHNRYSNWEAKVYRNFAQGVGGQSRIRSNFFGSPIERKRRLKQLWARLPFRPLIRFVWMYIFRLGFLDGRPGLIFCTLMSMHEAVIAAKIFEEEWRHRR
ncbi:MAG: glycosyltransferase family 2 protein [Acidobacteria bacterium]|nr:glycosyltransferase family 2 protein [Acidobacteriota bacterium]